MSYTIKNLREIDDVAPRFGFDSIQEARFAFRDLDADDTGLAYHVIKPNQHGGAHRHEAAEEIYVVIAGSGRVTSTARQLSFADSMRCAWRRRSRGPLRLGPTGSSCWCSGPGERATGRSSPTTRGLPEPVSSAQQTGFGQLRT